MLERIKAASARPVLHRAAVPILAPAGSFGEGCRIGRRRAMGAAFTARAVSIAYARAGVMEADHSE
ncbi:MAG: hypothetical protein ABR987_02360 [Terracidiphilus sp.]|jgi:hypothetical protein